jgi:hypothetical protein
LRSADFEGLIADDAETAPPALQVLLIDNTDIDDDVVPFLSACKSLRTLSAGGTKFTSESYVHLCDVHLRLD